MAWACRRSNHRGLPPHGSEREAGGGGGGRPAGIAPRSVQGARRPDRLAHGGLSAVDRCWSGYAGATCVHGSLVPAEPRQPCLAPGIGGPQLGMLLHAAIGVGSPCSLWRGADRVRRACSAAGVADRRRSLLGDCAQAAQAASLRGWSGARPALPPQRLRRPSSPALTRIPRKARSSAAAVLRSATALWVQVGRPVA